MSANGSYVMGLRKFHHRANVRPNDISCETSKGTNDSESFAKTAVSKDNTATDAYVPLLPSVHERILSDYVSLQEEVRGLKNELSECNNVNALLRRELQEKTEILNLILEKERIAREQREFDAEMTERAAHNGLQMYVERQNALIGWLERHQSSPETLSSSDILD